MKKRLFYSFVAASLMACQAPVEKLPDMPVVKGETFPDTEGNHINAHGGAILEHEGTYYWYGEHRPEQTRPRHEGGHRPEGGQHGPGAQHRERPVQKGVMCYTSTDLENWENHGLVLEVNDSTGSLLEKGSIVERPKVVYCPATGKYVLWFHHELKGQGYAAAHAAVATADNPFGPFEMVRSARVNPGIYPENMPDSLRNKTWSDDLKWWTPEWYAAIEEGMFTARDVEGGQMARDMTIFVDDDGKAYHVYSSEDNLTLQIAELDSTYTDHTGKYIRLFPGGHNEAPAIFKHDGTYWMIASGCTGWAPNEARLMRADNIWGPWEKLPNPCKGPGADLTFMGQSTAVMQVGDKYTFMADIWNPANLADSRHLWLPISFDDNGVPSITMPVDDEDLSAYVMVYFTDPTHDLFMATSPDGYNFTAVNDGKPIIAGDTIAEQKGIRDPHITRGRNGEFYMAMTDLHIFAQKEGLRDTEWERPGEEYGWGNNRGLVLMKSDDLVNWKRANVRIDSLFPETFGDIGCAWAPETVYDPAEDKMMLYFTMRHGNGKTKLYYAYTDNDFTTLVTEPKVLFEYPNPEVQILDADLSRTPDGRWCLAYVAQDGPSGIKMAFSDNITGPWEYSDKWIDFEEGSCEAPNVWKRNGENKYVLMYDIFSIDPHNFGFAETEDFKTFTNLGHFNEGTMATSNFTSPKHGAVMPVTALEKAAIERRWPNPAPEGKEKRRR